MLLTILVYMFENLKHYSWLIFLASVLTTGCDSTH